MTQFHIGQKVRCVDAGDWTTLIKTGEIYTVAGFTDATGAYVKLEEALKHDQNSNYSVRRFVLAEQPVADGGEGREEIIGSIPAGTLVTPSLVNDMVRGYFTPPPDNCIPDTAKRILALKPSQPVDPRAEGVARAVANLNAHEPRLGASRFQP